MQKEDLRLRCPSGIPGFDSISEGGFVRDTVNVIIGGPGAGKTTFLLQFLYKGITDYRENGLFVSLEPTIDDLYKDASALGWDFQKLIRENKCEFINIPPSVSTLELKGELLAIVKRKSIKRICFDPASLFATLSKSELKMRQDIYELMSVFKNAGVTVLLSAEAHPLGENNYSYAVPLEDLEFLADGVIELYSSGLGGVSDRALRIIKMRRSNHQRGPVPFELSSEGAKIISKKK